MAYQVLVGNKQGVLLGELEGDIGQITWRMNDVSSFTITLSKKDAKIKEELLQFGNRVIVLFDNGLPAWGGTIDLPRTWTTNALEVTCYSADYILKTQLTDRGRYYSDATVGYIFRSMLEETNQWNLTGITVGNVWSGGELHSPEYHFETVLNIIRDSICTRLSTCDYEITAAVTDGSIGFTANLYERRGSDKLNTVLMEGHNLTAVSLIEQGEIVNNWKLAGQGSDWGDNRIYSNGADAASQGTYGRRTAAKIYNDVTLQATLDEHAQNLLKEYKDPHNILDLETVSLAPAMFGDYDLGDSLRVILYSYGFGGLDTLVRVIGREYIPARNSCRLAVREAGLRGVYTPVGGLNWGART